MKVGIIDLTILQLLAAYIFIVILMLITKSKGIPREREIALGTFRMTIQLIFTGYILSYVFENSNPYATILIITIMEVFAVHNIIKRSKSNLSKPLKSVISFSMITGTIICILYFLLIVVRINPWYDPRYFIPLAGMIIGNSMTGISVGVNRLKEGFNEQKYIVEAALMLGATQKSASRHITNSAFEAAILPTINSMMGMGIVTLPGMMTGQILSGTSPLIAVEYQIAIMLGIVGSVSLSLILFLELGYKTFFNDRAQIIEAS